MRPWPDKAVIDAHEKRDRNRAKHSEGAPGASHQSLDHDESEYRENDDADQQYADPGDRAGHWSHLRADHVAERAAIAPRGQEQDGHVLHGAGEDDAGENPQRSRQVAHLRREHRADQRARAGDGREVMAIEDVFVGWNVIEAVIAPHRRRRAAGIDAKHFVGDEQRVIAVGEEVDAHRGDDEPGGIDRLAATQGHDAE